MKSSDTSMGRGKIFDYGNYAMFIHWGLYSKLANVWNGKTYYGIGEWLMNENMANADREEYKAVARTFDPKDFDAMKIAKLAKDAGRAGCDPGHRFEEVQRRPRIQQPGYRPGRAG